MKKELKLADAAKSADLWEEMLPTPVCPLWLCFSDRGLRALYFNHPGGHSGPQWPVRHQQTDVDLTSRLRQWRQETAAALKAYFAGKPRSFEDLTLDVQGTEFQLRVWQALRQVPFGAVTSYQALANSLGMPRSARAVGGALRANHLPIIIPCHRIISGNGSLGGFSAGLHYKRLLLSHERVVLGRSPIPLHGPKADREQGTT
jgi:methylated-DNA-[protein]-cysteine S-methyltransferase